MKPNYKALAERYRKDCLRLTKRLADMYQEQMMIMKLWSERNKENEELKFKYTEAMNGLIELQELIARKEGQG